MSEPSYIELTAAEAEALRGETRAGHRLEPVGLADGTFVLPVAVLADPAHVLRHGVLAGMPTRTVRAEDWVAE